MPKNPKQPRLSCPETATLRVIDASINRATEGLRVVEDFVRFVQDNPLLSHMTKTVRHDLVHLVSGKIPLVAAAHRQVPIDQGTGSATIPNKPLYKGLSAPWSAIDLHGARETSRDVGTHITVSAETHRDTPMSVCVASFQRVKQALRSLEEFCKLTTPLHAAALEALRYRIYTLERCVTLAATSHERLETSQLCVLVDSCERGNFGNEQEFSSRITELVAAGVGIIQLRDKQLGDAILVERARLLVELTRPSHQATPREQTEGQWKRGRTLAIINDRPDIAAITHADGVHLGQDDMSVKEARMIVGPRALIGMSTHSIDQARAAVLDGANYLGIGPTFPSITKTFADYPGLELLRQVAKEIRLPAYAIGGISTNNLEDVLSTGIDHIAVSGAVAQSSKPGVEASKLLKILRKSPKSRTK